MCVLLGVVFVFRDGEHVLERRLVLQLHDAAKVGSRVPKPPLLIDRQMPRWKRPPASALPLLFLPLNPRLPPPPPHPLICLPHFVRIRPALLIGFVRRGRFPTLNTRKYLPRYHAYVWFVTCAVVALQIGSGGYGGIVYEGYTFCGLVPYNLKNPFVVMEFVLSTLQARDQPPAFGLIAPRVPRVSTSRRHPPSLPPSHAHAQSYTQSHTHTTKPRPSIARSLTPTTWPQLCVGFASLVYVQLRLRDVEHHLGSKTLLNMHRAYVLVYLILWFVHVSRRPLMLFCTAIDAVPNSPRCSPVSCLVLSPLKRIVTVVPGEPTMHKVVALLWQAQAFFIAWVRLGEPGLLPSFLEALGVPPDLTALWFPHQGDADSGG